MTMCEPSPPQGSLPMELPLTSSPAASRARTLALLESNAAWVKEPVPACGPRSSDLLASYDRNTSSWRTSQHCLLAQVNGEADGLAEFSETWPSAGMMRNGKTFRRQPWALPIAESASGLWPTPCKSDQGRTSYNANNRIAQGHQEDLSTAVHVRMFPTPTATMVNQARATDPEYGVRLVANGQTLTLAAQVMNQKLWPTPRSCSAMAATITPESAWAPGRFPNLETVVGRSIWPTPQASDNRDRGNLSSPAIARRKAKGKQIMLSQSVSETSGALNPTWVEWLMGFPTGHTDLQPLETP